jgi:hypothetical protein
MISLRVH